MILNRYQCLLRLHYFFFNNRLGTSLVIQWLRLCTSNAGGMSSIPGQEQLSHAVQHSQEIKIH